MVAHNGHRIGVHAPGLRDDAAAAATTHHLLLGHGLAAAALRASVPGAEVGITLNLTPIRVTNDDLGSTEALEKARLVADASQNGMFLDPILFGRYPEHAPASQLPPAELILDGDLETIAAPIDFLGVNYYQPVHLRAGDPANLRQGEKTPQEGISGDVVEFQPDGLEQTNMGWLIDPEGLYELLLRVSKDAPGLPLYITENGCAAEDYVDPNGEVNDLERVKFLHLHLDACARAIKDGANLAGYYVWSLLDNFEWGYGYQKRFGIVFVDFATQQRIPKASAALHGRGGAGQRDPGPARRVAGIASACRLRHRQDLTPVAYANDRAYWCRWRRRQGAGWCGFGVAETPAPETRKRERARCAPRVLPADSGSIGGQTAREAPSRSRDHTTPIYLCELRERLLVVGDVAGLGDRVDDLPAHDALLVDDEGAADGEAAVLVEDAVGLGDPAVRPEVGQQGELEVLLLGPGLVREEGVHRDRRAAPRRRR